MAPPRVLRSAARRAHKASGLAGQIRLSFSDCLGPCREANVVFVYARGRALWFRRRPSGHRPGKPRKERVTMASL